MSERTELKNQCILNYLKGVEWLMQVVICFQNVCYNVEFVMRFVRYANCPLPIMEVCSIKEWFSAVPRLRAQRGPLLQVAQSGGQTVPRGSGARKCCSSSGKTVCGYAWRQLLILLPPLSHRHQTTSHQVSQSPYSR